MGHGEPVALPSVSGRSYGQRDHQRERTMSDAEVTEVPAEGLMGLFRRKEDNDPKLVVMRKCPLFAELKGRELKKLAAIIYDREYERGEYMFEVGQPGAAMFILKSGKLSITVDGAGGDEVEVAQISGGSFVGELALLDDSARSASAMALEHTEALAFFRSDLNNLLNTEPVLGSKIFRQLALMIGHRLKAMNEQAKTKNDSTPPAAASDVDG